MLWRTETSSLSRLADLSSTRRAFALSADSSRLRNGVWHADVCLDVARVSGAIMSSRWVGQSKHVHRINSRARQQSLYIGHHNRLHSAASSHRQAAQ